MSMAKKPNPSPPKGHVGLSADGVAWLEEHKIVQELIRLAEECGVFSIRG